MVRMRYPISRLTSSRRLNSHGAPRGLTIRVKPALRGEEDSLHPESSLCPLVPGKIAVIEWGPSASDHHIVDHHR